MESVVKELVKFYTFFFGKSNKSLLRPGEVGNKSSALFSEYLGHHEGKRDTSGKAFMMLRKGLIEKLSQYVSVSDPSQIYKSPYQVEHMRAQKDSMNARILFSLGLYKSALYFAKRAVESAQKLEIWDVLVVQSSILSNYFSIRTDKAKFEYYNDLASFGLDAYQMDFKLRSLQNKWNLRFSKKRKATAKELEELKQDVITADQIVSDCTLVTPNHHCSRLKLTYYDALMDYNKAIQICIQARNLLLSKGKLQDRNKLAIYHGVQMYCYLNLKDFENAKKFALELDDYFPEGSLNWFIFMEYYYVLSVQTENYGNAYKLLRRVGKSPAFGQLKGVRQQVWKLLAGYMEFAISSRIWNNHEKAEEDIKEFRVNKFLNEVVNLGADKTGIQVSVLILQVLFLLHKEDYAQIIDRKDALRRYIYRYLYSKENERSRIFMNMLLRVIESDFSYSITREKTSRLLKSLKDQQMNYQANLGGNEIIDYELLWNWVLKTLKDNWSTAAA